MDSSDTAKLKRDGDEDSINEPPSEDEVEETANTNEGINSLCCFPRDDGVDNNASMQTSEAAVMNKMKNFHTARSNTIPQNVEKIKADLNNNRKKIESSNNAPKIRDEEVLWQRKLNLAYGPIDEKEETPTKKPTIDSTSVAWQQQIKRKVRNAPPPIIDPDAPRVEEPPLPWERDERLQLESFADESSITHEDNVSDVQPTTDENVEDPPAHLDDDTPNTGTQNDLPIPHTEAWLVEDEQNQASFQHAIEVQGERIDEKNTNSAFQLLRKHFRVVLFCIILIIVILISVIVPISLKQQSSQTSTTSSSVLLALKNLSGVSDPSLLGDRTTPQGKAFEWILDKDPLHLSPEDENFIQRFVLAVFYFSSGGGSWDTCNAPVNVNNPNSCTSTSLISSGSAWLTNSPECNWGGIICGGGVTEIGLDFNGLNGTIPSELQHLADLEELNLEENQLMGTIPTELGALSSLHDLWLNRNQLIGTIPTELGALPLLEDLSLDSNQLTGTIPTELGVLSSLQVLRLNDNQLIQTIPTELGTLSLLEELYLFNNNLSGSMPQEACNLRTTNGGLLFFLVVDCKSEVACSCCTRCF